MARRPKTHVLEDLVVIVARLPWWAGLGLAALSYLVLHAVAAAPLPTAVSLNNLTEMMLGSVFRPLAMVGQFLVPIACVIAAAVSVAGRHRRQALVSTVASSPAAGALKGSRQKTDRKVR